MTHDEITELLGAYALDALMRQPALRVPLVHAHSVVLDGPVVALYNIDELASETGDLVDPEARQAVANLVSALANVARAARS